MSTNSKIIYGSLIVFMACILTIFASYPKLYSPYSFSVVIPVLFISELGLSRIAMYILAAMPTVTLYLIGSFFFINKSLKISKPTIVVSLILITLSIVFNIYGYEYGIKYQGWLHTIVMYAYNISFLIALSFVYKSNKTNPKLNNCLGFNVLLFSWLGWSAFPWLGELI